MGLPVRFIPHSVNFNTGSSAWINEVEATNPNDGVSLFEESSGSQTDREFVAIKGVEPTIGISTFDLSLLTTIGFAGLFINSTSGAQSLTVYGRQLPNGSLPGAVASALHLSLGISDGLIIPESIRAGHNTAARLSMMVHAILGSGGSSFAVPMIMQKAQTIISGAGALTNLYCAGPFKYTVSGGASRLVNGITDMNVTFGIQVEKGATDSDVYPTHVSIIGRATKIEFATKDMTLMADVGDGVSVSAAKGYFRQVAAGGQRTPVGTATHASVGGTAGMITPGAAGLNHRQSGTAAFTYTPQLNTNLITISVTDTIPTS